MICFLDQLQSSTEKEIESMSSDIVVNNISVETNRNPDRPEKPGLIYYDFEQGSQDWINLRNQFITASAIGNIVKGRKGAEYRNLIAEKASNGEYRSFFGNAATRWGHKYEPVADMLYEYRNPGVRIYEYGLVSNPKYPELAVSPDGITNLGEMLEIKCPYSRRIDGKIKYEYTQQMQQQLLVCEYEVCNFLECKFVEVECDRFWELFPLKTCEKGIIIQSLENGEKYNYHSPIELSHNIEHLELWYQYRIEDIKEIGGQVVKETYWLLDRYLCQKVKRDPTWYDQNRENILGFWEDVNRAKTEGWEQLIKKPSTSNKTTTTTTESIMCLLDGDPSNGPTSYSSSKGNGNNHGDSVTDTSFFDRFCTKEEQTCYI